MSKELIFGFDPASRGVEPTWPFVVMEVTDKESELGVKIGDLCIMSSGYDDKDANVFMNFIGRITIDTYVNYYYSKIKMENYMEPTYTQLKADRDAHKEAFMKIIQKTDNHIKIIKKIFKK